jgi:hypothetical protein
LVIMFWSLDSHLAIASSISTWACKLIDDIHVCGCHTCTKWTSQCTNENCSICRNDMYAKLQLITMSISTTESQLCYIWPCCCYSYTRISCHWDLNISLLYLLQELVIRITGIAVVSVCAVYNYSHKCCGLHFISFSQTTISEMHDW